MPGKPEAMGWDDEDDDWSGTPPEGRRTRDEADPGYWTGQARIAKLIPAFIVLVAVLLGVLVYLLT